MAEQTPTPAQQPGLQIDNANLLVPYSDNVLMMTNPDGVVLSFMQNVQPGRFQIVSRVGMSVEHARRMLGILTQQLASIGKPGAAPQAASTSEQFGFAVPDAAKGRRG